MKTACEYPHYLRCPECFDSWGEDEVEIVEHKHDTDGGDLVAFVCPNCDDVVESRRYG